MSKPWYTSRTIWLNIVGFVILALNYLVGDPRYEVFAGEALLVANAVLRFITTEGVSIGLTDDTPTPPTPP